MRTERISLEWGKCDCDHRWCGNCFSDYYSSCNWCLVSVQKAQKPTTGKRSASSRCTGFHWCLRCSPLTPPTQNWRISGDSLWELLPSTIAHFHTLNTLSVASKAGFFLQSSSIAASRLTKTLTACKARTSGLVQCSCHNSQEQPLVALSVAANH